MRMHGFLSSGSGNGSDEAGGKTVVTKDHSVGSQSDEGRCIAERIRNWRHLQILLLCVLLYRGPGWATNDFMGALQLVREGRCVSHRGENTCQHTCVILPV